MDEEPLVSYVICTFNSEEFIKDNLRSIKEQDYDNQEIIIVDNCSSDSTREIIEENFPEVKLIVMPNSDYGACETFNIGFETAKGEYIAIMDDDVEIEEKWTKKLVNELENNQNVDILQPRLIERYNSKREFTKFEEKTNLEEFIGCGVLLRSKVIEDIGYYKKDYFLYYNDIELGKRAVCNGYKIQTFPDVTTRHKGNPSAKNHFRYFYETRNSLWFKWEYYRPKDAIIFTFRDMLYILKESYRHGYASSAVKGFLSALKKFNKYFSLSYCRQISYRSWNVRNTISSLKNNFRKIV